MAIHSTAISRLKVPAVAAGEVIAAGCCPVPAAAAAVQILMFLDGVEDVEVDQTAGIVAVTHDPARSSPADLADELTFIGLPAQLV